MATQNVAPQEPAESPGFWDTAFSGPSRRWLVVGLVACFAIQTYLVYSDPPAGVALSAKALDGRRIWHQHNCQSCHQFYGFGGFLGPDLTNANEHLTRNRLQQVLDQGSGAMPAFALPTEDVDALLAFLVAMHSTGRGQARARGDVDPVLRLRAVVEQAITADSAAARGFAVSQAQSCGSCHLPFRTSAVGSPDLSTAPDRLDAATLTAVIRDGRGANMPGFSERVSEEELGQLLSYIQWLHKERAVLQASFEAATPASSIEWSDVPWWEFR